MLKKLSKMLGVALTIAMLTSLFAVATPAAADVSQPVVTLSDDDISKASVYTIRFTTNKQLTGNTTNDTITIALPPSSTTTVSATPTGTVSASDGWFGINYAAANTSAVTFTGDATAKTITIKLNATDNIGEGAEIRIQITTGIKNPNEIGDYTLTVATSKETTPVTSAAYSVAAPYVAPLAGTVEVYNAANIKTFSANGPGALTAALINAVSAGYVVKVGEGTYTENPDIKAAGVTIMAIGDIDKTIVQGTWTANATIANDINTTTIQGMTLRPAAAGGQVMILSANLTTVKDCIITKANTLPTGAAAEVLVNANAKVTFDGCTFDATNGAVMDTVIQVNSALPNSAIAITNSTFNLDASAGGADDYGVDVLSASTVTVDGCTFTGNSGIGFRDYADLVSVNTIKNSTFTGLTSAVDYSNNVTAKLYITSNTISDSTVSPLATATTATAALNLVDFRNIVVIQKNMIEDNNGYAAIFGAAATINGTGLSFTGNHLSGNVYGTKSLNTAGGVLSAILNYWGDNNGPTIADNPGGAGDPIVAASTTTGAIDYRPWTNTSTTDVAAAQSVVANGTLDLSTTIGIAYSATAAINNISLMKYTDNPATVAPPGTAIDGGYYDVYSPNAANVGALGSTTILFFNNSITVDTKAYYYSALQKEWVMCTDQAVAGNGAYVYVTLKNTGTSPTNAELNGTIFALVDEKTIPDSPTIVRPTVGDVDVTVAPLFTWNMVPGAVDYEIIVSADPSFTFVDFKATSTNGQTFYKHTADLEYGETYYWKVAAKLTDGAMTAYTSGIFSTMTEATVSVGDGDVTVTIPPIEIPEITIPEIVVPEGTGSAIPTYILWIIVVIGAVLVIALIVLIVRTRRVN